MNKNKILIVLVLVIALFFIFAACQENYGGSNNKNDIYYTDISVSGPTEIIVGEFLESNYTVKLTKSDATIENIPLTLEMINAEDYSNLFVPGNYVIRVSYMGLSTTIAINVNEMTGEISDFNFKLSDDLSFYIIVNYTGDSKKVQIPSFYNNKLVKTVGEYAFLGNLTVEEIVVTDGVINIEKEAFAQCKKLKSVKIPDSVTYIGQGVFNGCTSIDNIATPFVGETDISNTFLGYMFGANLYSENLNFIPQSLKSIAVSKTVGDYAFAECIFLTNISMGLNVTSIGEFAFKSCNNLTNIKIPNNVTSIGCEAFADCSGLESIIIPNSVIYMGQGVLKGCLNISYIETPFLGESVTNNTTLSYMYSDSSTGSILVPEALKAVKVTEIIGDEAFYQCSSLLSITISDSVISIGNSAFYGCSGLKSVNIGNGVTYIGNYAFYNCSNLTDITMGDNVKYIKDNAFSNCNNLTSIIIGDNVNSIGSGVFSDCTSLTNITISNKVSSIGDYAFENCSSLTKLDIPDSVLYIGEGAFSCCSNLTRVRIGNGIQVISDFAFAACNSLSTVIIGSSLNSIGETAFAGCVSLSELIIPDGVTDIGNMAFSGCISLTSVVIPNSITSIGDLAFDYCDNLTFVYYKGTERDWDNNIGYIYGIDKDNCYYYSEFQPVNDGNYWHYVEGIPTSW